MPLDKHRIRQAFNGADHTYDHHDHVQNQVAEPFDALCAQLPTSPQCIVDLGTGTGFLFPILRQHFPEALIIQIDLAESMLQLSRAKQTDGKCLWVCGDMDCNSLPIQCADLVVSLI